MNDSQFSKSLLAKNYWANTAAGAVFYGSLVVMISMMVAAIAKADTVKQKEAASQLFAESGKLQVTMIELFSSEGCSSCPPADRQLARLKANKGLFKSFVPIEFHVDYWNYLGWTDPFSNQQFSKRQRRYAKEWGNGRVYTPGFVIGGQEHALGTALVTRKGESMPGSIRVVRTGSNFEIQFEPTAKSSTRQLFLNGAILGNGLKTKVPAGENAGSTLRHEFVVLKHKALEMKRTPSGLYTAKLALDPPKNSKAESFSAAFWINQAGSQAPIQATAAPL
ncbi:MAG: DUF1223 domain-containing protein [Bdellovibrionales bacterium]|nr:DUF1223 domain-containing protein [Bdellovibrionales bacterium]